MLPTFHNHPYLDSDVLAHGFFGRTGGVSKGLYASLNCARGSYDHAADVDENRRRVAMKMGHVAENLCTLRQVHSPNVVIVHDAISGTPPEADAMVTNVPGLLLGILTADCAPVLFADTEAGVVGAAHAGWRGAHGGVIEHTVLAMEKLGARASAIRAVVGPCIAQASYEVGPEFRDRFDAAAQEQYFIRSNTEGHFRFDLPAYVSSRLLAARVGHAAVLSMDTCSDPTRFFSYRRATLQEEPDYGRQISVIGLKAERY